MIVCEHEIGDSLLESRMMFIPCIPRTVGLGCFSPVQRLDERSEASIDNTYI